MSGQLVYTKKSNSFSSLENQQIFNIEEYDLLIAKRKKELKNGQLTYEKMQKYLKNKDSRCRNKDCKCDCAFSLWQKTKCKILGNCRCDCEKQWYMGVS